MKKDSFLLNFILGVILMLLLAFAAKAQDKTNVSKSNSKQAIKKKKQVSAEEAKVLYEEKYGKQDQGKRKAYSRKDIEENITQESPIPKPDEKVIVAEKTQTGNQPSNQPKAIYKGPSGKKEEKEPALKTVATKSKEPVFLEHIEVNISSN